MFSDDHDGPELHIPPEALRKPKGAEVADDGTVECVACRHRVALANADIVGQGYRCAPCTHKATIDSLNRGESVDVGAHLSKGAREELRRTGTAMLMGGLALLAVGVVIFIAALSSDVGTKLGGLVGAGGFALAVTGSMKRSAAG